MSMKINLYQYTYYAIMYSLIKKKQNNYVLNWFVNIKYIFIVKFFLYAPILFW